MKKSLIALAVLGAFASAAQAQTNVQVGGRIQADVKNYKVGNVTTAGRVAKNEMRIDDDETSRFWIRGTEDLGGGLKALFYVENRFNTDVNSTQGSGNGLANGNTYLGLSGNWGQLTAGKHTFMEDQGNAVQYGIKGGQAIPSSMLGSKNILNRVDQGTNSTANGISTGRVNNSIQYVSPKFSGFKVTAGYSTNPDDVEGNLVTPGGVDYSKGQGYFLAGNYSNGPIFANVAYWDHEIEGLADTRDERALRLSGSYAFSFGLKVGAQFDRSSADGRGVAGGEAERDAWQIPVSYQFGNNTILASYTQAGDIDGEADSGAKMWTIGYDYALSKRTNVGVFYGKLDNDTNARYQPDGAGDSRNGSQLAFGESASIVAVAIKHTF